MTDADLDYWHANLEAALAEMSPETALTDRLNADDIAVMIVGESTREERAELIHGLERRGFEVKSPSDNRVILVDATAEKLTHPFADPEGRDP